MKWMRLIVLTSAGFIAGPANAQINYGDDFEATTLNPFWSLSFSRGLATFPYTAQAHSGLQSIELRGLEDGNAHLAHSLVPSYGQVSLWVYDTGSSLTTGSYFSLNLGGVLLGTIRNPLLPDPAQYQFHISPPSGGENTPVFTSPIDRTAGWHQFGVNSQLDSLSITIDGTQVYSGAGGHPISLLDFAVITTPGHPAWSYYFDDFQANLTPVPEPSTIVMAGFAAFVLLARRVWVRGRRTES